MVDVHLVCAENRHLYEDAIDQHHRIRRDIYIGEQRWRALVDRDGREVDQFDYKQAIYLLGLEPDGTVVSGTRLLPSSRPTLMSAVFPETAALRGMPDGPDVLEWTRFFVVASRREEGRLAQAGGAVLCAMLEYCLEEGVRTMRAVGEAWWMPRVMGLGWRPRPLGLPVEHDGYTLAGFAWDPTEETLAATRAVYGISRPCLVRRGVRAGRCPEVAHGLHG
ncbi:acyl-homoserine-lactone synthase [Salinarimonas soli]|nr:acyl-homoserine-lactone synthase [Salinarimonas soli]